MTNSDHSDSGELLTHLYALGALTEEERRAFEAAVERGEIDRHELMEQLETFTRIAEETAASMPRPRAELKGRIMRAIDEIEEGEATKAAEPLPEAAPERSGHQVIRDDGGGWEDIGLPGILMKVLYREDSGRPGSRITFLARLEPGATYPHHRHMGVEECLVISGDLHVDDQVLHAGDFIVTQPGTIHRDTSSSGGCLLMISSPFDDEFL